MGKNSVNSKGKKRRREEEEDEEQESESEEQRSNHETISLENNLTFSDTLIALRIMHAQFPKLEKVSIQPFILRSQLYSSVIDRTQVDRDLESLKKEKVLRTFKLNTGQDDDAIMFMEDYLNQIESVEKRIKEKRKDETAVFDWFKSCVIVSKLDPSVEHQELCSLLSLGGKVKDEHVSLLINAGLLTRQLIDPNMYWFAIPNIGSVLKGLSQGRKELVSFLNRRKYKEMMLALLEKKRLRMSPLDMRFHLRDLIGSGHNLLEKRDPENIFWVKSVSNFTHLIAGICMLRQFSMRAWSRSIFIVGCLLGLPSCNLQQIELRDRIEGCAKLLNFRFGDDAIDSFRVRKSDWSIMTIYFTMTLFSYKLR